MPQRTLRFCPKCKTTQHAAARETCRPCGELLLPMLDEAGAMTKEFLAARGSCCDNGCRNCPYDEAAPANASNSPKQKVCGRCGGTLSCHSNGCWCEGVSLSPATLKWLERNFADCLCPACLEELSTA